MEEGDSEDLDVFHPTDKWKTLKSGDCFAKAEMHMSVVHGSVLEINVYGRIKGIHCTILALLRSWGPKGLSCKAQPPDWTEGGQTWGTPDSQIPDSWTKV